MTAAGANQPPPEMVAVQTETVDGVAAAHDLHGHGDGLPGQAIGRAVRRGAVETLRLGRLRQLPCFHRLDPALLLCHLGHAGSLWCPTRGRFTDRHPRKGGENLRGRSKRQPTAEPNRPLLQLRRQLSGKQTQGFIQEKKRCAPVWTDSVESLQLDLLPTLCAQPPPFYLPPSTSGFPPRNLEPHPGRTTRLICKKSCVILQERGKPPWTFERLSNGTTAP